MKARVVLLIATVSVIVPTGVSAVSKLPEDAEKRQTVVCGTTQGNFTLHIYPDWAPLGASRFLDLVEDGFFNGAKGSPLFRVIKDFLVQFGVAGDPEMDKKWLAKGNIPDDPRTLHGTFERGMLSFAGGGKDSRSTQLFISYKDSTWLGNSPWETPFGKVVEGMEVVDRFYDGYGDLSDFGGTAPSAWDIQRRGVGQWSVASGRIQTSKR